MSSEKILKQAMIEKQGDIRKTWSKKWWVLTENELKYYTDVNGTLRGSILIRDILSVSVNDYSKTKHNTLYVLLTNKRSYWLAFDNRLDCLEWKEAIEEAKRRYIVNSHNEILLPETLTNKNGPIDPQIAQILQKVDGIQTSKDLRNLLRDVERIAIDLPSNEAAAQHQLYIHILLHGRL